MEEEYSRENITEEFTVEELIGQAMQDDSWEEDPQKRAGYAIGFFMALKFNM